MYVCTCVNEYVSVGMSVYEYVCVFVVVPVCECVAVSGVLIEKVDVFLL